ncbi:alcohol dehydrogenase [Candidatus Hakubella thermalkaliphila]|uniref:Alcohol dehydrogenase n=2 Tax=Candidatus Hakubella thermalkaliphila TaxID=2754717 RepID=A0A6V8P5J9_9ACTN|nr:iron-containing alcohol dehydrogenase [Candidatus Hakubella thermalkaliphila]GFP27899.1 alcohol dehydrogenase [Candidatus Hakubella thermalkaliphila]GFP35206.1 alcohol dehydrogenase [Candidatus Hakubella thermalkaliphila]GFP43227.1 alcohol dehydrogenase [Candidatus Hakubella thermalkaliphila]
MRYVSRFYAPRRIILGPACVKVVGKEIRRLGGKRVLLVTDAGVRAAGLIDKVVEYLEAEKLSAEVFDDVQPNPTVENVVRGLSALRSNGSAVVVGVGGGSVLDAGKMIAALATNGGRVQDYEGVDLVQKRMLPFVAVNTTAGTGSEVSRWAVITDTERQVKMAICDENIVPDVAIDDPLLTISLPQSLTASTGMDALTHAIEALVAKNATVLTDSLALKAITLISENLRCAYAEGGNVEAREKVMYAQMTAGLAFSNAGLGNVHAMAHQLGAVYNMPHGLANAVLLPYVMEFNLVARGEKFGEIAWAMGEKVSGLPPHIAARKACSAVMVLNMDIGIPRSLRECGIKESDLDLLVKKIMKDGAMTTNPRDTSMKDMERIWRRAFDGLLEAESQYHS